MSRKITEKRALRHKYKPYPEAVEPKRKGKAAKKQWEILDVAESGHKTPRVSKRDKMMWVPLSKDGEDTILHEMAHTKWSPLNVPEIPGHPRFMQAIEDARVNLGRQSIGLTVSTDDEKRALILQNLEGMIQMSENPAEPILASISSMGTDLERALVNRVTEMPEPWGSLAEFWYSKISYALRTEAASSRLPVAPFKTAKRMASQMAEDFDWNWKNEQKKEFLKQQESRHKARQALKELKKEVTERDEEQGQSKAKVAVPVQKESAKPQEGDGKAPEDGVQPKEADFNKVKALEDFKPEPLPELKKKKNAPGPLYLQSRSRNIEEIIDRRKENKRERAEAERARLKQKISDEKSQKFQKKLARIAAKRAKLGITGEVRCATMAVVRPKLTETQVRVKSKLAKVGKSAPEGTMVRTPHRLMIDGAIFAKRKSGTGCTVLVDMSGSMRLSTSQVEEIVLAAGGHATVAIYSGDGNTAQLKVIAQGQKRCSKDDMRRAGIYNSCDLSALDWLSRQSGPRIWVCDGYVNGQAGQTDEAYYNKCMKLAARCGAERFDTADSAIKWLRGNSKSL